MDGALFRRLITVGIRLFVAEFARPNDAYAHSNSTVNFLSRSYCHPISYYSKTPPVRAACLIMPQHEFVIGRKLGYIRGLPSFQTRGDASPDLRAARLQREGPGISKTPD